MNSASNVVNKGLTVDLKNPLEKGELLIAIHGGSRDGLVEVATKVFRENKS